LHSFIEIGPSASKFAQRALGKKSAHGCTLRSARDQQRHFVSAASVYLRGLAPNKYQSRGIAVGGLTLEQLHADVQMLASCVPTESFCLSGWENCNSTAPHAIANHSLYDISLDKLAEGMRNHSTRVLRAYMHFPVEALVVEAWESAEKGYAFDTIVKDGRKHLRFRWIGDPAFAYVHDREHWLAYLLKGGFETPFGFNLMIEKSRCWGSQFELSITRVTAGGNMFYQIPNVFQSIIFVPNYRVMAKDGFCKRAYKNPANNTEYFIPVDCKKFKKLYEFCTARVEKAFTLETARAYARTLTGEMRIAGEVREYAWNVDQQTLDDIVLAVFILITYRRRLNRSIVDDALEHMDKIGETDGILKRIALWIREGLGYCEAGGALHNHAKKRGVIVAGEATRNLFHKVQLRFQEDVLVDQTIKDHLADEAVYFPFEYDVERPAETEETAEDIKAAAEFQRMMAEKDGEKPAPSWACDFQLKVDMPTAVGAEYNAQDQHQILVTELEQAIDRVKVNKDLRGLHITLCDGLASLKKKTPEKLYIENMMALTGVPGGAKTGRVRNEIIPKALLQGPVLVLCPTRALADDYGKDLPPESIAKTVHTGLRELQKRSNWSLVIIDEAFTMPMGYINFVASYGPTLLVGDPQQITHVDFSDSGLWNGTTKLSQYLEYIPRQNIRVTKRCPQDVTLLPIIRKYYPGISSSSDKQTSINYVHDGFDQPTAQLVCFTQEQKNQMQLVMKRNALTVHECQGKTFSSVVLHYAGTPGERKLISDSPNHVIVGLTRHTNMLYIRDCSAEPKDLVTAINDNSPLDLIADQSNIEIQAMEAVDLLPKVHLEETVEASTPYVFCKADHIAAEAVLSKIFPAAPQREQISAEVVEFTLGGDAKGVLKPQLLGEDEQSETKVHKVHVFDCPQRVKITKHHNDSMLVRSALERLTKSTKNMSPMVCKKLGKQLYKAVEEQFDWELPENAHHQTFLEALEKMQSRGQGMDSLVGSVDWKDRYVDLVKMFLKDQQKPTLGCDPLEKDKAGQGISAWQKDLNLLMSPWTRLLEQVLTKQSKGKVKVMSGMSDMEVMAVMEADATPGERYIDNDWTQFDSSQNNLGREILRRCLARIGCPEILLSLFLEQLKERRVCFPALSLTVHDKKDSGAPHTLIDNCLFNLAICLDIMEGFNFLYIKGDDSLARGISVSFVKEKMQYYITNCGYQFKPASSGSFVSFLVTEKGVAYDLPRLAAKVTSRCYVNEEDYVKYQIAVGGTLKPLDIDAAIHTCKLNALYYFGDTRCEADFDVLMSFLLRFSRGEIPFSGLIQKERLQLRYSGPAVPSFKMNVQMKPSLSLATKVKTTAFRALASL